MQCETQDKRSVRRGATTVWSGVADKTHRFDGCRALRDVGAPLLDEVEAFFVFDNEPLGTRVMPMRRVGIAAARELVAQGRAAFEKRRAAPR